MFSDVKVGDPVLVNVDADSGWSIGSWFNVKRLVQRVTPTQFQVQNKMYYKSNGRRVGKKKEEVQRYDAAKDQTEEYNRRVDIVRLYYTIRSVKLDITDIESLTADQLDVLRQVFMK